MAQAYGYKGYIAFGTETNWGTAAGTANYSFLELNSGADGLDVTEERLHTASVYSINMDKDQMEKGQVGVSGELGFDVRYEGMEKLLKAVMGTGTTSQPEGTAIDVYQHVFTLEDVLGTGMTIEVGKHESAFKATGAMLNTLTFDVSNTGFLTASIGIIGREIGTGGTVSPNFPTAPLVVFDEGVITWGGTAIETEAISITLNNALSDDRRHIGSRFIKQPLRNGKIEVTGSMTVEFDSTAEYNDFRDAQERALNLTFTGGTGIGTGAGTSSYSFAINLPYVRFTGGLPKIDNEGRIKLELPFKAYSDGTNKEMTITLVNATATI